MCGYWCEMVAQSLCGRVAMVLSVVDENDVTMHVDSVVKSRC